MLTRSSTFETYASVSGHQRDVILAVTQNSVVYYFSTRALPRGLNSEPVYPMLLSHGPLVESIDIFTKQWRVSDVNFTLSDESFYPQSGGAPVRVSELLEDLNGEICELYQWVDGITDIADCLLIFSGHVLQSLEVDKNTAKFTAKDRSKLWDKLIPERVIGDEWSDAPTENLLKPIPLVYGDFSTADFFDDAIDTATGLAKMIAYTSSLNSRYAVADHDVVNRGIPYRLSGPTVVAVSAFNGSNSEPAWIGANSNGIINFQLSATLPGVYNDETFLESQANRDNLTDDDLSTKCIFRDRVSDDGDNAEGLALFGIKYENIFRQHLLGGGECKGGYYDLTTEHWPTNEMQELRFYLYYGVEGATDFRKNCGMASKLGTGDADLFAYVAQWKYPGTGDEKATAADVATNTPGDEWAAGIYFKVGLVPSAFSDGIVNNDDVAGLKEARLQYAVTTPFQLEAWCNAKGKKYTTVLGGFTTSRDNLYHWTATLEDPCYIIEDLYRTHFLLGDNDIDKDSFDNAHNINVQSRINITEKVKVSSIVRQLAEQSTFIVAASGAGKLRCIALNDKTPSISEVIQRGQLVNDNFQMTKTHFVINNMDINSRWQGEYNRFLNLNNYADSISQGAVRDRAATFSWQNILGSSAAHVAQHYVNSVDGIWSKEHIQVKFVTAGFTFAHLQVGDWIELDDDVDNLKKAFGTSWEGKRLLITDIKKNMDSVSITAIELYETIEALSVSPSPSPEPSPSPNPSPDPDGDPPWGRYIAVSGASPAALDINEAMTDGNTSIEIGSAAGHINAIDHYCLQFAAKVGLASFRSFACTLDRSLTGSPLLQNGQIEIYYSNNNNTWTKWGTTRTPFNGGLTGLGNVMWINGDGPAIISAFFWKFFVVIDPGDSNTIGLTELTASTI